jgi:hypothetical protein
VAYVRQEIIDIRQDALNTWACLDKKLAGVEGKVYTLTQQDPLRVGCSPAGV